MYLSFLFLHFGCLSDFGFRFGILFDIFPVDYFSGFCYLFVLFFCFPVFEYPFFSFSFYPCGCHIAGLYPGCRAVAGFLFGSLFDDALLAEYRNIGVSFLSFFIWVYLVW